MDHLVTARGYAEDQVKDIIQSFDRSGETFWQKRNVIKIFEVGGKKWNVKSFKVPHLVNRFAYRYIRKSKARRSFEHANELIRRGMLTPAPIAYAEFWNPIGLGKSYFVSENLEYDFDFNALYNKDFPNRHDILEKFTEFTFRLHEKGIHHFDHSRGNTLVVEKGNGQYDFYLIDLNRMTFEPMDYEKRIGNFDRLGLKQDMIPVIGNKYASLIGADPEKVIADIQLVCDTFAEKRARKKRWKGKFGLASDSGQV